MKDLLAAVATSLAILALELARDRIDAAIERLDRPVPVRVPRAPRPNVVIDGVPVRRPGDAIPPPAEPAQVGKLCRCFGPPGGGACPVHPFRHDGGASGRWGN